MKLVIHTQHKENYGAHDWDGKGACPQYWKFKGGDTYVVEGLTDRDVAKINKDGIPTLSKLIESVSDYFIEYITMHMIVADDDTPWDEWDEPYKLFYIDGKWNAMQVTAGRYSGLRKECLAQRKTYVLADGGEQVDFKCEIQLADELGGGWHLWGDANEILSKAA